MLSDNCELTHTRPYSLTSDVYLYIYIYIYIYICVCVCVYIYAAEETLMLLHNLALYMRDINNKWAYESDLTNIMTHCSNGRQLILIHIFVFFSQRNGIIVSYLHVFLGILSK